MGLFGSGAVPYRGVTAFVGMPGSGKTFALVQAGADALKRGRPLYVNRGFSVVGAVAYSSFEELVTVPGGATVLLDEAPTVFNARQWAEFPPAVLYRLTQVRKDGLEVYYSAIHEEMVDVTLRRMTMDYWHCRALTKRFLIRRRYPPEQFRKAQGRADRRQLVWVDKETAELYDTLGKVAVQLSMLAKLHDVSDDLWVDLLAGESLAELVDRTRDLVELHRAGLSSGGSSSRGRVSPKFRALQARGAAGVARQGVAGRAGS